MTDGLLNRRYLSLWWPYLAADRWQLSRVADQSRASDHHTDDDWPVDAKPPAPPRPLVFIEKIKGMSRLVAVDARALTVGLRPGMSLADARAAVPALQAVASDGSADRALLTRLAELCGAFTPAVALDDPDGLILDITGCAHLFGGESALVARVRQAMAAVGVTADQTAVAPTPDMARALSRYGPKLEPVSGSGSGRPLIVTDAQAVRALPIQALECAAADTLALKRAGLKTIGDVATRPSVLFSARFTPAFTTQLSRVLGEEDRRIVPRRAQPVYRMDHVCAEPVVSAEVITLCLAHLAEAVGAQLLAAGVGGRVFDAVFFRTDGAVRRLRVETSQPTRDARIVMRLLRDRLDALADPLDVGFGFDLIRLHVARAEPYDACQTDLGQTSFAALHEQQAQVALLLDRLGTIFGQERVVRLRAIDTHIPDWAQAEVPVARSAVPSGHTDQPWSATGPEPIAGAAPARPLFLFERPHPIDIHAWAADGAPERFGWRRVVHEIAAAEGPERIASEWWRQPSRGARDYYRVETRLGRRFWVFQNLLGPAGQAGRWFLHGEFA